MNKVDYAKKPSFNVELKAAESRDVSWKRTIWGP